jgi:spermidine synthase
MIRALALLLTVLTGFTGLVYEVAWQKYLATLLGSHSEATAAVLGIFLGGLSVGYWLFGVLTDRIVTVAAARGRPPRLLLVYGLVESAIGLYALLFPWIFEFIRALSYAIPHGPGGLGFAIDVGLSILLIGPPTVMMGGTIPILTQALARSLEDATRFHAFVYAFNTAGAFLGALAAGFVLVPWLGLEGVSRSMGLINLLAGGIFVALGVRGRAVADLHEEGGGVGLPPGFVRYAFVAFLVGFAMMAVQTVVIRLAGLAFGSSPFTFSMVVAVFVLCIALGSFAVSAMTVIRRWFVVANLWLLSALLMILYPFLNESPYWAHLVRTVFRDHDAAFHPYMLLCFLALLAVVGPAALVSGATLPLLFHDLRGRFGHLGRMAGALYSWNTVGSLTGALLGGYALLFWLDLHHIYRIAVAATVLGASILTLRLAGGIRILVPLAAASVGTLFWVGPWDPDLLTLGLFRTRAPRPDVYRGFESYLEHYPRGAHPLLFHADGPNSTVSVRENRQPDGTRSLSIWTNGKPDSETYFDRQTLVLSAILPAMMAEKFERGFVIGYATGISAGELASLDTAKEVVVAEISPAVIDAAPLFDFANLGASTNPRVRIVASDAYRALMRSEGSFDVISSEPSNPWVAGVEMLYSREFLEAARDRLSPGGVFGQWIHRYEIDDRSLELILRTYASVFDHVAVLSLLQSDQLLLGFNELGGGIDHFRLAQRAQRPDFARALERARVDSFPALLAHEILPVGTLHAARLEGPVHTLLHPRLSDLAGRAFFRGTRTGIPFTGSGEAAEAGARNSMLRQHRSVAGGELSEADRMKLVSEACRYQPAPCAVLLAEWQRDAPESKTMSDVRRWAATKPGMQELADPERLNEIGELLGGDGTLTGTVSPERARRATEDFRSLYTHGAPFDPERLIGIWSRCREGARSQAECRERVARAQAASPLATRSKLETIFRSCRESASVGRVCQAGLDEARALVRGEPAPGSE